MNLNLRRESLRQEIATHVLRGPLSILPFEGEWLASDLSLRRSFVHSAVESLALYLPSADFGPAQASPVIRKVNWYRSQDRQDSKRPTLRVGYSSVPIEAFADLNLAIQHLDRSLGQIQWAPEKFSLDELYREQPAKLEEEDGSIDSLSPIWEERHLTRRLTDCFLEFDYNEWSQSGEFDTSWLTLWELLKKLSEQNPLQDNSVQEHYILAPQTYAEWIESLS
jgi:hypothetical protein